MTDTAALAQSLRDLYAAPEILRVVNVWDAISTKVVADVPGTTAIATAGHSIAASLGYEDGGMPLDVALGALPAIVAATSLPVTADLDDGYADAGETIRRAIGLGVVGANVEDRMKPFDESVARVTAMVAAAEAEGVPFALNARTDAVARKGEQPLEKALAEAVRRGKAFLDEGATAVFVPGLLDRAATETLVAGLGIGKLSVIGFPGALTAPEYEELGVARISYGPLVQRVALRAVRDLAASLYAAGGIPEDTPALN